MQPAIYLLRRVPALALALMMASGLALAADKKDEKKADDKKKPADASKAADPKAAAKDTKPATNAVPLVVPFPKSVFSTALDGGKDPFFPASKRRLPKPPEPPKPPKPLVVPNAATNPTVVIGPTNQPPAGITNPAVKLPEPKPELVGSANLSLRGIAGTKARRIAEVHTGVKGYTFLKGDSMLIRLPNDKQLKVRCLDIRERSAIFQVDDEVEPRELYLREGIF